MVIDREHESGDAIQLYLREIGKTPLLTGKEERVLAKRFESGDEEACRIRPDRGDSQAGG